ncbi:MAG: RNA pseudouridine synthase [Pseudobdellovibrio sp.]|nr:RNA pseudouridine synthase [Pseudobdellovibrio sp.]
MKKTSRKYQPKGFHILHEDRDVIVGNKSPGLLTVGAMWEKENTVHNLLNQYIRKGNSRSRACVFVVHRLDQATSGALIFAKTEEVQQYLKNNWKSTVKTYYTIVHGHLKKKADTIESYLSEDEDYHVHSSKDSGKGVLAQTQYEVIQETGSYSLVKVNLLTGKKNQIRVHMAELGHPIVGDVKYGKSTSKFKNLALHSASLEFTHPFSKKRILVKAKVPDYFKELVPFDFDSL